MGAKAKRVPWAGKNLQLTASVSCWAQEVASEARLSVTGNIRVKLFNVSLLKA
ncbi:MAG: hypothetical protein ACK5S6_02930 [bacterium]